MKLYARRGIKRGNFFFGRRKARLADGLQLTEQEGFRGERGGGIRVRSKSAGLDLKLQGGFRKADLDFGTG